MWRNIVIGVLSILVVALVIYGEKQRHKNESLHLLLSKVHLDAALAERGAKDETERLRTRMDEAAATERDEARKWKDEARELQSELNRLRRELAEEKAAREQLAAAAASTASEEAVNPLENAPVANDDDSTTAAAPDSPMKQLARMMKDPAMKQFIRAQQQAMMDMTYKSLYDSLELNDEDMAKLKELLLDRQMNMAEMGLEIMDENLTPEQKEEFTNRYNASTAEIDKAIETLLGEDDYKWFKTYEDTKSERMQLGMFNQSLDGATRLSTKQEDDLVLAMFEARSEFQSLQQLHNPNAMNPENFTEEKINQLLQDMKKLNEQYVNRATGIMNEEQLRRFTSFMEQQQAMQEMGLRMSLQMFKGNAPSGNQAP
jgi:hypothetical protein